MSKVCFYTPYDLIDTGELGSYHVQLTTDYDVTENPNGPGLICKITKHDTRMRAGSGRVTSEDYTYQGDLSMQ